MEYITDLVRVVQLHMRIAYIGKDNNTFTFFFSLIIHQDRLECINKSQILTTECYLPPCLKYKYTIFAQKRQLITTTAMNPGLDGPSTNPQKTLTDPK